MNLIHKILSCCAITICILCNLTMLLEVFKEIFIIIFKITILPIYTAPDYKLKIYDNNLTMYVFLTCLIDILSLYVTMKYLSIICKNIIGSCNEKQKYFNEETESEETDEETESEETESEEIDGDETESDETEEETEDDETDEETEDDETEDDETEDKTETEETDGDEIEETDGDEIEETDSEEICDELSILNNEKMITNCMILLESNAKRLDNNNKQIKTLIQKIKNYEINNKLNNYHHYFTKMIYLCCLLQIIMTNLFSVNNIIPEYIFVMNYGFKIIVMNILVWSYQCI